MDTRNIHPDTAGYYEVQLGATKSEGLPSDLFVYGEPRWLGVSIDGAPELARVLLLSVPYAMKAGDARRAKSSAVHRERPRGGRRELERRARALYARCEGPGSI